MAPFNFPACEASAMPWLLKAKIKWGPYTEITGNGRFAVVAYCEGVRVSLWDVIEDARNMKTIINTSGCCKSCKPQLHEVIDLQSGAIL